MSPQHQKALFLESKQGNFVVADNDVPSPSAGEILVKVKASGLNPIDWKVQKFGVFVENYPIVLGVDVAGDVVAVGEGVTGFSEGDRVVAQSVFSNTGGGFQQYTLAVQTHTSKLPVNISYDQAATFPSALAAAYLSLYNQKSHGLGFTSPIDPSGRGKYSGTPLIIFGGATTVGQYAIQLAKLSGFSPIIVTSSLKHETRLKEYGAGKVISRDVDLDTLRNEISNTTSLPIKYIFDAVSAPQTQQMAHDILASGGYLQLVQAPQATFSPDKNVKATRGIRFFPENLEAFKTLYSGLYELLANGHLKPCPVEVQPGGLAGIPGGLERLEKNQVSGFKLIVRPDETN
ncbi:hypothetical protein AN958_05328 [Leucoagaricus sp. SymC.cos]|nr:hypothetical protein AN958_05328 [Leucoagaricus sp. SymC.cos]